MKNLPFIERNMRRSRVYGGRLLRSVASRPLKYNCCFYHIPKSGGTSLSEALHGVVPFNRQIGEAPANTTRRAASILHANRDDEAAYYDDGVNAAEVFALREAMLISFMANNVALAHGHVLFSRKAHLHFGGRYKYITMLRDPMARVISNYRAATRAGYVSAPFRDYLSTTIGRAHATHNLRYFSGRPHVTAQEEAQVLVEAKGVIDLFSVIGFVDEIDAFIDKFEAIFGARLTIGNFNKAKAPMPELTIDDRRRLREVCAADIELHNYAREVMSQSPAMRQEAG